MSQSVKSSKIERTCDGCGDVFEYEYVGMVEHPEIIREMENWTYLTREIWNGRDWVKMVAHAKGAECVMKANVKMDIMIQAEYDRRAKAEEQTDDINLADLRQPPEELVN